MAENILQHYAAEDEENVHIKSENILQNYGDDDDEDEEEVPVEIPLTVVKAEPIDPGDYEDINSQAEVQTEDAEEERMITDDYPSQFPETSIKAEPNEPYDSLTPQVPLLNVRVELEEENGSSNSPQQVKYDPMELLKSASQNNILSEDDVSLVRLKYRLKRILSNPSEKVKRRKFGKRCSQITKETDDQNNQKPHKTSRASAKTEIPGDDMIPLPKKREVKSEKIAKETPQQRERRLSQKREYKLRKKASETNDERQKRLKKQRDWESRRLSNLSPEERELHLLRRRQIQYRKRTGKDYFEEDKDLIRGEEGIHVADNVDRYKKFIDSRMWNMCKRRFLNRTI